MLFVMDKLFIQIHFGKKRNGNSSCFKIRINILEDYKIQNLIIFSLEN